MFKRQPRPRIDLTGVSERGAFFVRSLTIIYRIIILIGFYLLFYAMMADHSLLEMATVTVLAVTIVAGSRQIALHTALFCTRLRHGVMSDEERIEVSDLLNAGAQQPEQDSQPDKKSGV